MSASFPHLPAEAWQSYLDDEAGASLVGSIEQHLAECPACESTLVEVDPTRLFRKLRVPAPIVVWDGFLDDVTAEIQRQERASRRSHIALMAGIAATLVVAVVLAVAPAREGGPSQAASDGDPCPQIAMKLKLSPEECRALFARPIAGSPELIIEADLDLRGL